VIEPFVYHANKFSADDQTASYNSNI